LHEDEQMKGVKQVKEVKEICPKMEVAKNGGNQFTLTFWRSREATGSSAPPPPPPPGGKKKLLHSLLRLGPQNQNYPIQLTDLRR
jgi:hypothetical protein